MMKNRSSIESALFLSLAALLLPSAAQKSTDSGNCYGLPSPNATVNSTGTQPFNWYGESWEWYFTLTLNNTRPGSLNNTGQESRLGEEQEVTGWISAPANTNSKVCAYAFEGLDVAPGNGDGGCLGVLSPRCIVHIMEDMSEKAASTRYDFERELCIPPPRETLEEFCKDELVQVGQSTYLAPLFDEKCVLPSPPGARNHTPSKYQTSKTLAYLGGTQQEGNYTSYDRLVRQVRPWIITKKDSAEAALDVKFVCVAPNQLVEGSRIPEGEWPPSAAGRNTVGMEMLFVVIATVAWVW